MTLLASGIAFASSHAADPAAAMAEIKAEIGSQPLAGALMFCSHRFDRKALSIAIKHCMGELPVAGSISSGELTENGYDADTLSFIGFPAGEFHLASCCLNDFDHFDPRGAAAAIRALVAESNRDSAHLGDDLHQVALFLVDGLSHREELLTMTIQDALGDIPLIGGSSGDGLRFNSTAIFDGATFRSDAAVIAILTTPRPLHVFKAQQIGRAHV